MSHDNGALAVSDLHPSSGVMCASSSSLDEVDDIADDAQPPTRRLNAFDLATALAAMDHVDELEDDGEWTRDLVSSEVDATEGDFTHDDATQITPSGEFLVARPRTDDEPTLDVPAPSIPPGTPSPLGEEESTMLLADLPLPDETLTLHDLGLDPDEELPLMAHAPSLCPDYRTPSVPYVDGTRPDAISRSRVRVARFVPPEEVSSVRRARQAVDAAREAERRTRALVLGIWGVAVVMAGVLTYVLVNADAGPPERTDTAAMTR